MLRQSMIKFLKSKQNQALLEKLKIHSSLKTIIANMMEYGVHKRLRDEILMIPIPKAKVNELGINTQSRFPDREAILDKQSHHLKSAIERVSYRV